MINLLKKYGLGDPQTLANFAQVDPKTASNWLKGLEDLPAYIVKLVTELEMKGIPEIKRITPVIKRSMRNLFQSANPQSANMRDFQKHLEKLSKQIIRHLPSR